MKLFWNVDTQRDFILKDGKLPVPGAGEILPNLKKLTDYARGNNILLVTTMDWHREDDGEFNNYPDYLNTFPPHCLAGTVGAVNVDEVLNPDPDEPLYIPYNLPGLKIDMDLRNQSEICILKNRFDVREGNKHTWEILDNINADEVVVYGVATNVCVDCAVQAHLSWGTRVHVVEDAIKGLPMEGDKSVESTIERWINQGVNMVSTKDIISGG